MASNMAPLSWVVKSFGAFGGSQENRSRTNSFDEVAKSVARSIRKDKNHCDAACIRSGLARVSLSKTINLRMLSCCPSCIRVHLIHRNCTSCSISKREFPSRVICSDVAHAYLEAAQEQRGCRREEAQGRVP